MKRMCLIIVLNCLHQCQGALHQQILHPGLVTLTGDDSSWKKLSNYFQEQLGGKRIVNDIPELLHELLIALKSSSFPTAVATNISQQCIDDSQSYVHNLYLNQSLWALQMKESSGNVPPGLFGSFNFHADGLFDECQAVRAPNFDGQYCTVFFSPEPVDPSDIISQPEEEQLLRANLITILQYLGLMSGTDRVEPKISTPNFSTYMLPSISLCLPSSCSALDLGKAVAELIGGYVIGNQSIVTVTDGQYCFKESNKPPPLDGAAITFIVTLSILGLLVISATVHEAWRMYSDVGFDAKKDGQLITILHCFSALNNGRKLLSTKVSISNDNLSCVHGIRFLSTCWVVLGHSWSMAIYKIMNPNAARMDAMTFGMQTIVNGTVSVDTFLLMSGLLVSYLLLKELDRNKGRFNVGLFYLHRYLRLTLVYAIVLGFIATLEIYIGTGPNWYTVTMTTNACRAEWWKQFIYFNNLFPTENFLLCMGHTWYLAVDMQLFIISPLLIYPLWRWRRIGLVWLALIALASHAAIFTVYAIYDFMPAVMFTRLADTAAMGNDYNLYYYLVPWTRAPPYLVGIWAGWYLHITKQTSIRIPKVLIAAGWVFFLAVGIAVLYGLTPYLDPVKVPEIDPAVKMTYGPLHRTAWGMMIAWIIFACSRGYGGFVNRFLSWKGFVPLGRLTYCVYLVHYDYLTVFFAAIRKQYYYTIIGQLTTAFGAIVIVFGLAFVVSTTIEASFLNLEKLIFSPKPKNK